MQRELISQKSFNCKKCTKSGIILDVSDDKYLVSIYKYPAPPVADGKEKFEVEVTINGSLYVQPFPKSTLKEAESFADTMVNEVVMAESDKADKLKVRIELLKKQAEKEAQEKKEIKKLIGKK